MDFLLSHWHCILPIAIVGVAALFLRAKPRKGERDAVARIGGQPNEQPNEK